MCLSHNMKLWVSLTSIPEQRRRLCWIWPFPTPPCHHDRSSCYCYYVDIVFGPLINNLDPIAKRRPFCFKSYFKNGITYVIYQFQFVICFCIFYVLYIQRSVGIYCSSSRPVAHLAIDRLEDGSCDAPRFWIPSVREHPRQRFDPYRTRNGVDDEPHQSQTWGRW